MPKLYLYSIKDISELDIIYWDYGHEQIENYVFIKTINDVKDIVPVTRDL
jgi:hypothetical protein